MAVCTLKELAYKKLETPGFARTVKSIGDCPYELAVPLLKLMNVHQLSLVEENTPRLGDSTHALWKVHTLKAFPTIADTHEIDADNIDWRQVYHEMQQDRRDREQAARERLKANYSQIAKGKNERKVQVTQKTAPTRQQVRSAASRGPFSALTAGGGGGGASIMSKAVKASLNSVTRDLPRPAALPLLSTRSIIRPNPNSRHGHELPKSVDRGVSQVNTKPRPSKFLLPTTQRK